MNTITHKHNNHKNTITQEPKEPKSLPLFVKSAPFLCCSKICQICTFFWSNMHLFFLQKVVKSAPFFTKKPNNPLTKKPINPITPKPNNP